MVEQRQALRDGRQALRHIVAQTVHRLERVGLRLLRHRRGPQHRGRVKDGHPIAGTGIEAKGEEML